MRRSITAYQCVYISSAGTLELRILLDGLTPASPSPQCLLGSRLGSVVASISSRTPDAARCFYSRTYRNQLSSLVLSTDCPMLAGSCNQRSVHGSRCGGGSSHPIIPSHVGACMEGDPAVLLSCMPLIKPAESILLLWGEHSLPFETCLSIAPSRSRRCALYIGPPIELRCVHISKLMACS